MPAEQLTEGALKEACGVDDPAALALRIKREIQLLTERLRLLERELERISSTPRNERLRLL